MQKLIANCCPRLFSMKFIERKYSLVTLSHCSAIQYRNSQNQSHYHFKWNDRVGFCGTSNPLDWKVAMKSCQNSAEVEKLLRTAARVGDVDAQYSLGVYLLSASPDPTMTATDDKKEKSKEDVRADIAKVRKMANQRGSKSDFDKAMKLRAKQNGIGMASGQKSLVIDKSINSSPSLLEQGRIEGLNLVKQAAASGHAEAMCYLGNTLLTSCLDTKNIETISAKSKKVLQAVDWYHKASVAGCPEASFNLGVLYHDGVCVDPPSLLGDDAEVLSDRRSASVIVVQPDFASSLKHFEHASDLGEPIASLWCGYCYCTGEGGAVRVDGEKALCYLNVSVNSSGTAAKGHFYLSELFRSAFSNHVDSSASFVAHLHKSVELEDEDAMYSLADLHLHEYIASCKEGNMEESTFEDVRNYLISDLSNPVGTKANCHIDHTVEEGCTHFRPALSEADHSHLPHLSRAVELLQSASSLGQANATLTLGALVYQGIVKEDAHHPHAQEPVSSKRRAFQLYNLAAEQGSLEAWRNIASMHFLGDGVPKCENTAREIMRVIFNKK